jgi:peroxiredoxin Q/BCP
MLNVGDTIPEFQALDSDGNLISKDDLLGSLTVIYFYPKDDTPGCTKEACSFRDRMQDLELRGVIIIGISPDDDASHQQFAEKYNLNFSLVADPEKKLCKLFHVLKGDSLERTTFVIDDKGLIRWLERPVNVDNHTARVIKALDDV